MPDKIGNTEIFNTDEVAMVIGKGRQTVLNLMNEGVIEGKKVGQTWVVTRNSLVKYLEQISFPESIIDYRLGIKSPKTGKKIKSVK